MIVCRFLTTLQDTSVGACFQESLQRLGDVQSYLQDITNASIQLSTMQYIDWKDAISCLEEYLTEKISWQEGHFLTMSTSSNSIIHTIFAANKGAFYCLTSRGKH